MTPLESIKSGFSNWYKFDGRASRPEFWWFFLIWLPAAFVVSLVSKLIETTDNEAPAWFLLAFFLFSIFLQISSWSINSRRLHDINKSGWWQLIGWTVIGLIPLLIWYCRESDTGPNRFERNGRANDQCHPDSSGNMEATTIEVERVESKQVQETSSASDAKRLTAEYSPSAPAKAAPVLVGSAFIIVAAFIVWQQFRSPESTFNGDAISANHQAPDPEESVSERGSVSTVDEPSLQTPEVVEERTVAPSNHISGSANLSDERSRKAQINPSSKSKAALPSSEGSKTDVGRALPKESYFPEAQKKSPMQGDSSAAGNLQTAGVITMCLGSRNCLNGQLGGSGLDGVVERIRANIGKDSVPGDLDVRYEVQFDGLGRLKRIVLVDSGRLAFPLVESKITASLRDLEGWPTKVDGRNITVRIVGDAAADSLGLH